MQCPVCPVLLVRLQVGAIELDECPRCLGMWFDKGEMQAFLGARLATKSLSQRFVPPGESELVGAGGCPRCTVSTLSPRTEHGHTVSGCARCGGAWLTAPLVSALLSAPSPERERFFDPFADPASSPKAADAPVPPTAAEPHTDPEPAQSDVEYSGLDGTCAACNAPMSEVTHERETFFQCSGCDALFFPQGGLPYFLKHGAKTWPVPAQSGPEPKDSPKCPGCTEAMAPISLSGYPARLWACSSCWSMFASSEGVRRLLAPEQFSEPELSGHSLALWRMLDAFTDWILQGSERRRLRYQSRYRSLWF